MRKAGFEVPDFDFEVPGVTSISCDPHKYDFTPKGSLVVMYSRQELRKYSCSQVTKWTGGIYATTNLTGSRTGSPVAATWAAMCMFGLSGYVETTTKIVSATLSVAKGVQEIDGLKIVGRPDVCVVAFTGTKGSGVNCYSVLDCMKQRFHWELQCCQNPSCIHFALTLATCDAAAATFVNDLQECVNTVRADVEGKFATTAGLYAMTHALPGEFVEECSAAFLNQQADALGDALQSSEENAPVEI